jgi:hypothetical protein
VPDVASTSPLDMDAILAMFPTYSTNNYVVPGSSNDAVDSAQAHANTMANPRGVGESRTGADNVNQQRLEYFDFQDPLYGHMDWPMASIYGLYDVDYGQNSQV